MTMPNFLVIGAAKCGTDALCAYLDQHPQVYISANKEPNFFVAEGRPEIPFRGPRDRKVIAGFDGWTWSLEKYRALFDGVTSERAIGEGSTWYIYDADAPLRIRRHLPDVKLVAVLRNPVDRAYSAFTMMLRDGRETTADFSRALAMEDERVRGGWELVWHYRRMGMYYSQVKRYYETFDPAHVRVVLYDEFNSRPADVMRDLFTFLGVDDSFQPDMSGRHNVSLVPRHLTYHRFVSGQSPLKTLAKAAVPAQLRQRLRQRFVHSALTRPNPLDHQTRQRLVDVFRADVLSLQELIGRDLSGWLR